jgi:hypothetical protein
MKYMSPIDHLLKRFLFQGNIPFEVVFCILCKDFEIKFFYKYKEYEWMIGKRVRESVAPFFCTSLFFIL